MAKNSGLTVVALLLLSGCQNGDPLASRVNTLRDAVRSELPNGSSPDQVISFLEKRNIEHTPLETARTELEAATWKSNRRIVGSIPHAYDGFFSSADIRLTFLFDDSGKLASSDVQEVVRGP